jgi:hypothetical protein
VAWDELPTTITTVTAAWARMAVAAAISSSAMMPCPAAI